MNSASTSMNVVIGQGAANSQSRFAWILDGHSSGPDPVFDQAVRETPNFVALPSLGSLVAGWLLVVPKRRMLNLRELSAPERAELADLKHELSIHLEGSFSAPVYQFEHGPASVGSPLGCGVDQAHLHLVPLRFDLLQIARSQFDLREFGRADDPWAKADRDGYIMIHKAGDDVAYGCHPQAPKSQLIRSMIAQGLGTPDQWDYRSYAHRENAARTVELVLG